MSSPDGNQKKAEGLEGGLKNALARGYNLEEAKKSFVNSGYEASEVEEAASKIEHHMHPVTSENHQPIKPAPKHQAETNTSPQAPPHQAISTTQTQRLPENNNFAEKKVSKKLIVVLVVIGALVIIGAALLGIFWDKLFS
jgi:hypothetical protein